MKRHHGGTEDTEDAEDTEDWIGDMMAKLSMGDAFHFGGTTVFFSVSSVSPW